MGCCLAGMGRGSGNAVVNMLLSVCAFVPESSAASPAFVVTAIGGGEKQEKVVCQNSELTSVVKIDHMAKKVAPDWVLLLIDLPVNHK